MFLVENDPRGEAKKELIILPAAIFSLDGAHHCRGCKAALGTAIFREPSNPLVELSGLSLVLQNKRFPRSCKSTLRKQWDDVVDYEQQWAGPFLARHGSRGTEF